MDLSQHNHDVAAKAEITLGGTGVDTQGIWPEKWEVIDSSHSDHLTMRVLPATATIVRFSPTK
jgi:hypothetical protein